MAYAIYLSDRRLYYGGFFQGWVTSKELAHKFTTKEEAKIFYKTKYGLNSDLKVVKVN